ncbi:hypothetical protein AVEN_151662-1 [Araneus ventricosus]|uniref:Uncharacterized protein n=1 Tax=Araneus ventricosus TaxID=182803 RepID=A0A4Y2JV55_ARAVE|nr:hypothetical protein AVEN_151662-1 [Araneus ventricosus]
MSQVLPLIRTLHGAITKEIRPELERDVKYYILLSKCYARIDVLYSSMNTASDHIQTKSNIYEIATEKIAVLESERKVLDNLVKCLKFYQNYTGQELDMIKSEIITGAVYDERCVYSFLCIADGFRRSLRNLSRLIIMVKERCSKVLRIFNELREECRCLKYA